MRLKVDLDGGRRLGAKVDLISKRLRNNIKKDVMETGQAIVNEARANLIANGSYITGNLHDSIEVKQVGELDVVVGTDVEYAPYVEYGTSRARPYPYWNPAVIPHAKAFDRRMKRRIRELRV